MAAESTTESTTLLGKTLEKCLNPTAHMIEYVDYDLEDSRGKPQYPGANDLIKGDRAIKVYWGINGVINKRHVGDLRPAAEDPKPGFFGKKGVRNRMCIYRIQAGLIRISVPIQFISSVATKVSGSITLDIGCDIPGEYLVDETGAVCRVPFSSTTPDEEIRDEESQMLDKWAQLLQNNLNEEDLENSSTKVGVFKEGQIYNVKYLTAGAIQAIIHPDINFHVLDFFHTLKDENGMITADMTGLNEKISATILEMFNKDLFLSCRGLKVVTKPVFDKVETAEEERIRLDHEERLKAAKDEREIATMRREFDMERAMHDMEYKKQKEQIEHAYTLAKIRYDAVSGMSGE